MAAVTVLAGMGVVSGGETVAPAFEGATGHKVIVSFEAGPSLMQKVNACAPANLVTHQIQRRNYKRLRDWQEASSLGLKPCPHCRPPQAAIVQPKPAVQRFSVQHRGNKFPAFRLLHERTWLDLATGRARCRHTRTGSDG